MRTIGVVLGVLVLAGLVVLAVAGVTGATAILVTGVAIMAMIGLGNTLGGRHTPNRAPHRAVTGTGPAPPGGQDDDAAGAAEE